MKVNTTIRILDQVGNLVSLDKPANRIVSLVPSLTELLFDIDLEESIIGRTKFCIFPDDKVKNKQVIGGTKDVKIEVIKDLKPDLVIANKEENHKETVDELRKFTSVYTSNISSVHSAVAAIEDIGTLTNRENKSFQLIENIENEFGKLRNQNDAKTCIYLIWKDPYMTIGKDTFIYEMLQYAGFKSVILDYRYPTISLEEIEASDAKYVLLSSEPYPFKQKHLDELQEKMPSKRFILVDGTYFSWYGSRIKYAPMYFNDALGDI